MADRVVVIGAIGLVAALFPNGRAPIDPQAPRSSADCGRCHTDEHADWSTSRHAVSYSNAVFQASFANARMKSWCLNCHAPLGREVAAEGVSCVACHVREGRVLALAPVDPAAQDVHAVTIEPLLADSAFCGGCHQFRAPRRDAPDGTPGGGPLQDTLREWDAWGGAESCQQCHLPDGRHLFRGAHDPDLVRAALSVGVERDGDRLRVVLTPRDVGHDVPTGDPFRHLLLKTCADAACADPIDTVALWREFRETRRSWTLVADHTLSSESAYDLDARGASSWRLEMRYGDPAFEPGLPADEVGYVIAEGTVPP